MSRKHRIWRAAVLAAATLASPLTAQDGSLKPAAHVFNSPKARTLFDEALAIAGTDLRADAIALCRPQPVRAVVGPPPPAGTIVPTPRPRVARTAYTPNQVFDNMWFFGTSEVGATVVKTSKGLVLIDTLTTAEDAERVLLGGMQAAGLNPSEIRYVIITHAHGDHHGGLAMLRSRFPDFRVVMSAPDWAFSLQPFYMPDGNLDTAPTVPAKRSSDVSWNGEFELRLGDTKFRLLETPGHTPGTAAVFYDVKNGNRNETVAQWGGGSPLDRVFSLRTVQRFANTARKQKATVQWSSHTGRGFWGAISPLTFEQKTSLVAKREGPNPFLTDRQTMSRYLNLLTTCKSASELE